MKYKIEKWEGDEPKTWEKLEEHLHAGNAISIAASKNREQESGSVIHRVVEIATGKVVYVRGFIKK